MNGVTKDHWWAAELPEPGDSWADQQSAAYVAQEVGVVDGQRAGSDQGHLAEDDVEQ